MGARLLRVRLVVAATCMSLAIAGNVFALHAEPVVLVGPAALCLLYVGAVVTRPGAVVGAFVLIGTAVFVWLSAATADYGDQRAFIALDAGGLGVIGTVVTVIVDSIARAGRRDRAAR